MKKELLDKYEAVIGLEIHAQLLTRTKMFCRCSTNFGDQPNSNTCPVCLGMPGSLPVVNKKAIEFAIRASLGLGFSINAVSQFSRKNYFYPDLSKGYQISQFDRPLALKGSVKVETEDQTKSIGITRLHVEEDSGKSIHDDGKNTKVDFNRAGVPLIEIVSEPDIRSPFEAEAYLQKLRQILVYLEVCNGNMEEGSLRCDGNISIRPKGSTTLNTKTEIKNINSFRFLRKALEYEFIRQIELVESGGKVEQETRLWDQSAGKTRLMRTKEEAHDYRYFPEPDLPLLRVEQEWIDAVSADMPELPDEKINRFEQDYSIPHYDATVLTMERPLADYYEAVCRKTDDFKLASNWVMGEVLRILKEKGMTIDSFPVSAKNFAGLLKLVSNSKISGSTAKEVLEMMLEQPEKSADQIVEEKGLAQVSDEDSLRKICLEAVKNNPGPYGQYKEGKTSVIGFFVGQVMKASRGKANPKMTQKLLKEILDLPELP
jgi:aspartyl-tRNA(Asn)/glutamyl-tRNA(Gln) amidotransferase subunit B